MILTSPQGVSGGCEPTRGERSDLELRGDRVGLVDARDLVGRQAGEGAVGVGHEAVAVGRRHEELGDLARDVDVDLRRLGHGVHHHHAVLRLLVDAVGEADGGDDLGAPVEHAAHPEHLLVVLHPGHLGPELGLVEDGRVGEELVGHLGVEGAVAVARDQDALLRAEREHDEVVERLHRAVLQAQDGLLGVADEAGVDAHLLVDHRRGGAAALVEEAAREAGLGVGHEDVAAVDADDLDDLPLGLHAVGLAHPEDEVVGHAVAAGVARELVAAGVVVGVEEVDAERVVAHLEAGDGAEGDHAVGGGVLGVEDRELVELHPDLEGAPEGLEEERGEPGGGLADGVGLHGNRASLR